MTHEVRTFNSSGKCMHVQRFVTAEKAYEEYNDIIENAKTHLPKGYDVTVVRYRGSQIMSRETVVGTAD